MVKVRDDLPKTAKGSIDLTLWAQRICYGRQDLEPALLQQAADFALSHGGHVLTPYGDSCFRYGLDIAEILKTLEPDQSTFIAAILVSTVAYEGASLEEIETHFGAQVSDLIRGVCRVESTQKKQVKGVENRSPHFVAASPDNLRRMLLAVVDDIRVVLIKLAERVAALRASSKLDPEICKKIAHEANQIYAPLANRLGIGQIKWEIEDLAFRYLEPQSYKSIAQSLAEKRKDREHYIDQVIDTIRKALKKEEVDAEVNGRVKHIYSIWRKMKRKNLDFSEIYDVRAIRIIVSKVRDCYAALGVVHSLWQHIPKEFDDYIATPKENGYQSLHTAVVGPQGKTLEIQIRTQTMHAESELGVAAHWVYKEGGPHDPRYQDKLKAIRHLLEETEGIDNEAESEQVLHSQLHDDRIYVFSPNGDVIDLPAGSTPLDFAFSIHTELGYRCRGAKVNGKMTALSSPLQTGDQVEILAAKQGEPSRDWLNLNLGYLKSSKGLAKVHAFFRRQKRDQNIEQGKDMLEKEFKRLHLDQVPINKIAHQLKYKHPDDLYAALGGGDCRIGQVLHLIQGPSPSEKEDILPISLTTLRPQKAKIFIDGVGNLKSSFAKCCKPVPFDPIVGYITLGRGVSIHRKDCMNVLEHAPEQKLIEVQWGGVQESLFPVDIEIDAYDRQGLLRDITSILSNEKIQITGSSSQTFMDKNQARIYLTLNVNNLETLGRILNKIYQLPNVLDAKRVILESKK